MKSIIFAALAAYASADVDALLGNMGSDAVATASNDTEALASVDVQPVAQVDPTPAAVPQKTAADVDDTPAALTSIDALAVVPEDAEWETETKIITTDIKDNKMIKISMDPFEWDQFDATMFTDSFKDILDTMGDDDQVVSLAQKVKEQFRLRYVQEEAALPQVCDTTCRDDIRKQLVIDVQAEWITILTDVQNIISRTVDNSRTIMEQAYKDAFSCEPGCPCEFVENRYAYLISTIREIDTSIAWYESEIAVRKTYIGELDEMCPEFWDKYNPIWAAQKTEHENKVASIKDWQEDDHELDSLVDQDAFYAKYGFKYASSEFDRYFKNDSGVVMERSDINDYDLGMTEEVLI